MRGKTIPPETLYKVMALWAVNGNVCDTAKRLQMPESTVRRLVKSNRGKPEFVKLCDEKKEEFADKATEIINKGLRLLSRRLDTAIDHEDALDELIRAIYETPAKEIPQDMKSRLVSKINSLQLQKVGDITTAIGTLYDKRALATGGSTGNAAVTIKLGEADVYAG